MHLERVQERAAGLHLGPLLSEVERRYLLCDATFEVWFERDEKVIGLRSNDVQINRRLRRAEHRDRVCGSVRPGVRHARHPTLAGRWGHRSWPAWCWCARITTRHTIGA